MKKLIPLTILALLWPTMGVAGTLPTLNWNIVYNGYGEVQLDPVTSKTELVPMVSTQPSETHAALVLSQAPVSGDYKINVTVENVHQLREGSAPNPWEAPWLIFGYKPGQTGLTDPGRTFSYLILKPNGYGLEFGEALPSNGQNFLWTSRVGADSYNVGQPYQVELLVQNETVKVTVDGVEKFTFNDVNRRQLTSQGYFGFYSEDAHVRFSNMQLTPLSTGKSFAPAPAPLTPTVEKVKKGKKWHQKRR